MTAYQVFVTTNTGKKSSESFRDYKSVEQALCELKSHAQTDGHNHQHLFPITIDVLNDKSELIEKRQLRGFMS